MLLRTLGGCLVVVCAVGVAGAQTAATRKTIPPVKMGLWETPVTSQLQGVHLPPMEVERLKEMSRPVPGEPQTTVTEACLTPDQWRKSLEGVSNPPNSDCTIKKHEVNERNFSYDISCKSENGPSVAGHWEMHVVNREHAHGAGKMTTGQAGPNGQIYTVTTTVDSHYVRASCGDVVPGHPKLVE